MKNKQILLHVCCAPCATASIERLEEMGYNIVLFFSNSNIFPRQEYEKRLSNAGKLAKRYNLVLVEDNYDHDKWLESIQGLEDCPEKGKRCEKCFRFSLERSARKAKQMNIPAFTTTLTVSPHKVSRIIFQIASQFETFEAINFKKQNGFFKSLKLSKECDLYRQNYCGCEFSIQKNKDEQ
ncbi:hypothetical protein GF407_12715 [candidate division KSB1 bacterium]|nr:hypothetical protein [candidate division KSB1 bacterium]